MDCGYLSLSTTYTTLDTLQLYQGNPLYSEVLLGMKLESSTYPSGLFECQNFEDLKFHCIKPSLKKNTLYHIMVLISGAKSGKGCKGLKTVKIAGVTFTFSRPC